MALETWTDIGSTLKQTEDNLNRGKVPSDQGFPYGPAIGINNSIFNITSPTSTKEFKATLKQAISDYISTNGNPKRTPNGAFRNGLLVRSDSYRRSSNSTLGSLSSVNYNRTWTSGFLSEQIVNFSAAFIKPEAACGFVLRIPVYYKALDLTMPVFCLVYTHGNPDTSYIYQSITTPSLPQYDEGVASSSHSNYIVFQNARLSEQTSTDIFYGLKKGDGAVSISDLVNSNLSYLQEVLRTRGCGVLLTTNEVYSNNQLWSTQQDAFVNAVIRGSVPYQSGAYSYYYPFAQELEYSTFPIWDISNNVAEDVYAYVTSGTIANTWYHQSSAYEPAVDAKVSDATTIWKLQVVGDTNPKYRINYQTPSLGTASASVRRKWRGNIFVDSWWSSVPSEKIRQFEKSDIVLYDKPYVNHGVLFSVKYSDVYDKVLQFVNSMGNGYVPPSSETWLGNTWLSNDAAYKFRIGLCTYCDDQISNIVYIDVIYDSTDGVSWGTLEDHGDDSRVVIEVYDDDVIDDLGGETYIPVPVSDDGYTGVIDVVDSDSDTDYDSGSGDLPEDTITPTSGTGVSIAGRFSTTYQVTPAQLKAISDYFWDDGSAGFMSKYINAVNNPIESIISVGYMPYSVTSEIGSASVFIGNVNLTDQASGCTGYVVDNTTRKVTIGELEIPEVYSSFLDYQPYTNLTVFLPYIGFKTLPTNVFMGKTMKVEYVFDIITGACKALLYADGKYILSFDSDCMIRIPLTSSNNSDVFMQRLRSAVEAGVSIMSAGIGSTSITSGGTRTVSGERFGRTNREAQAGRAMRRIQSWSETSSKEPTTFHSHNYGGVVANVVGAGLDIAMAKHTYETYGGASSAVASVEPMSVYVIIDSPTVQYPATYNHNCGKPCELSKYLSSLNGYTEVDGGVDLNGIPCTDAEKEEIHALLVSGVYL